MLGMNVGEITVPTLIVHHEKDNCKVTPYDQVMNLKRSLTATSRVEVLSYEGGAPTAKAVCGPYHYHGFRGIEEDVAEDVGVWIKENTD